MAVITLGSPQKGDAKVVICDVEVVPDQQAAKDWFRRMLVEQPWQRRS